MYHMPWSCIRVEISYLYMDYIVEDIHASYAMGCCSESVYGEFVYLGDCVFRRLHTMIVSKLWIGMYEKWVLLSSIVRPLYWDYKITIVECLVMLWIITVRVSNTPLILLCDSWMEVHTTMLLLDAVMQWSTQQCSC